MQPLGTILVERSEKVTRSSGEAELYACNLGASKGLGLQTVMKELGWNYEIKIHVDANATIGTLHRRGLGKLRHVEVEELWLQQEISKKKISVSKVKGTENTADIGTKPVKREAADYYMKKMGFEECFLESLWWRSFGEVLEERCSRGFGCVSENAYMS